MNCAMNCPNPPLKAAFLTFVLASAVLLHCGPAFAANPTGELLGIEGRWVHGWATDADMPEAKLDIHFYVDGPAGEGTILGGSKAKYADPTLEGTDRQGHAFRYRLPADLQDGEQHTLHIYALNVGEGKHTLIAGPKPFTLPKVEVVYKDLERKLSFPQTPEVWMCGMEPWVLGESGGWAYVQQHVDVLVFYTDQLNAAPIEKVRKLVEKAEANNIKLAVELGGLVDWESAAKDQSGERSFACEWAKARKLTDPVSEGGAGGTLSYLEVDGAIRRMLYPFDKEAGNHTVDSAVNELADCLALWREKYPELEFQLVPNFPNYGWKDLPAYYDFGFSPGRQGWGDYHEILGKIFTTLADADIPVRGLSVDTPYGHATGAANSTQQYSIKAIDWFARLRDLQAYCHDKGLKFNIMFNSESGGERSDKAFYEETLAYLNRYVEEGGKVDGIIVQSWYPHPTKWVPETEPYTMTHLVKTVIEKVK